MRPSRNLLRAVVCLTLFAFGCDASTANAPPPRAALPTYTVWEVRTMAELQTLLSVKGCEGWQLAQVIPAEERFIVIVEHYGPAPPVRPECREA